MHKLLDAKSRGTAAPSFLEAIISIFQNKIWLNILSTDDDDDEINNYICELIKLSLNMTLLLFSIKVYSGETLTPAIL